MEQAALMEHSIQKLDLYFRPMGYIEEMSSL